MFIEMVKEDLKFANKMLSRINYSLKNSFKIRGFYCENIKFFGLI